MTEQQAREIIDLLQLILQELRNGSRPKVGIVSGSTGQPEPTVDAAPVRG